MNPKLRNAGKQIVALGLAVLLAQPCVSLAETKPAESITVDAASARSDTRMAWWRDARYGMFIHWGLYAVPAGSYNGKDIDWYGEWIMNSGKIPVAEYAKFAGQFNPMKFNADEWVNFAKEAGMKYMIITAKHHDGFCMYNTKVDDFNIVDATPFKRDPVKELAAACAKQGIKFGVYYSQAQDWHHPGGGIWGKSWDKAQEGDYDAYLQKVSIPQVRELLAEVNPAVLWFDTPIDMKPERTREFLDILKAHPALIYNNRLGNGVHGDTETPEQEIPANGFPGRDWETCMTMNDTWGYKTKDHNYKSTTTLLRNLIDIASKGGNYLLNVGPSPEWRDSGTTDPAAQGSGRVVESERRVHLRNLHRSIQKIPRLGPRHQPSRKTLSACLQLAGKRQVAGADVQQGEGRQPACQTRTIAGDHRDCRGGGNSPARSRPGCHRIRHCLGHRGRGGTHRSTADFAVIRRFDPAFRRRRGNPWLDRQGGNREATQHRLLDQCQRFRGVAGKHHQAR